ncbi:MAG TPA: GYF domain-containing protein [Thermogutta sp.]|nr:GYF domain-containing protein [Thermogutta sp.]
MSVDSSRQQIHVRFRGRVFGPYSADELRRMVQKGKTAATWEISLDGQNWRPIQELETLLQQSHSVSTWKGPSPSSHGPLGTINDADDDVFVLRGTNAEDAQDIVLPNLQQPEPVTAEVVSSESMWYYTVNDEPEGPIPESHLAAMAATGLIPPDTLVWTVNMSEWRPLRETRLARHLQSARVEQPATVSSLPPAKDFDEEPREAHVRQTGLTFAEELEMVLDEDAQHLNLWFRVLLGAAILKALWIVVSFVSGGALSWVGLLCDMGITGSVIGISILMLRTIARLRLGTRFIAHPKRLDELYSKEKPKRRESPWSNPVTEDE